MLITANSAYGASLESVTQALTASGETLTLTVRNDAGADEVGVEHFALTSPSRYVIDLMETSVEDSVIATPSLAESLIQSIRVGRHPDPKTRVVLDLGESVRITDVSTVAKPESDATIITISLAGLEQNLAAAPIAANSESRSTAAASIESEEINAGTSQSSEGRSKKMVFGKSKSMDDSSTQSSSMVFGAKRSASAPSSASGAAARTSSGSPSSTDQWNFAVDRALLESGWIDSDLGDGANMHLQTIVSVQGSLPDSLEVRLAGRVDGQYQLNDLPDLERTRFDYDESWLRYRNNQWQFTAGAQRIIWGRTDEFSPTDRLSTRDFTRLLFDDLQDRRRANPALRLQWLGMNQSLDAVILPVFREAEWPAADSVWFPYNAETGDVAGLPLSDLAKTLLRGATVNNDIDGEAGYGLRYSQVGSSFDYAVTVQRVHNPEPYFSVGRPPTPTTPAILETVYPRTWVVGGDAGMAVGSWTLRAEFAWLSDAAYTSETTFQVLTTDKLNWVVGAEIFPGDGDLRLTAQLSGNHILDAENALDWEDVISLIGDVETPFDAGGLSWNARMRYSIRLDETAYYLHPELAITSWEPSELYLGLHLLGGDDGTQQGFYSQRDALVFGWRAKF